MSKKIRTFATDKEKVSLQSHLNITIMYTLVYNVKRTESETVSEYNYSGEQFRLKKNALHFLREISKGSYIENDYAVEDVKNGLNCYKSKKNAKGVRETIEIRVRIEKV